MKNNITTCLLYSSLFIISGCQVKLPSKTTPDANYYGHIDKTMVIDGQPKQSVSWIVFSDRSKNTAYINKKGSESPKEIKFLEPLMVIKHSKSKNLVKVAEYNADALMQKLPSKSVKSYGWVSEGNLLLWSNALSDRNSGFTLKAAIVPNNTDVTKNANSYIKNDSAIVYSSPNLSEPLKKKIPIGQLVYVYKKSEDNRGYLVGKNPKINLDSVNTNIYGWVSSNMLSTWGERSAIKVDDNYDYSKLRTTGIYSSLPAFTTEQPIVPITDAANRSEVQNIFPTPLNVNKNTTKYFASAFDYNQNYINNVLGEKLSFARYKEITRKSKNLNIIFTVDVSAQNRSYSGIAKSIIQDVQRKISELTYYKNVKYSVVLYKNNSCGNNVIASVLSNDYNGIFNYIDAKTAEMKCEGAGGQPVNEALNASGRLLSTVPDETNLIVLIGSSAADTDATNTIRALSKAKARILAFQTQSGSSDSYNDFVLLMEKIISTTAKNITDLNKEKIADQSLILNKNNFNLIEGDAGVYSLDYPKNSMTQAFVVYPKKREDNSNANLIKAFQTLLQQITDENINTYKSLTSYFKSDVGSDKTIIDSRYAFMFPNAPSPLPVPFASQLLTYDYPVIASGYLPQEMIKNTEGIQKGILISENEYDVLTKLYEKIYKETAPNDKNFNQRKAISKFAKILKENSPTLETLSIGKLYDQPMRSSIATITGFDNSDEQIMSSTVLRTWKKHKIIKQEDVVTYFKNYRVLADRLLENKNNPKIKIIQNGTTFYWLNEYYMPFVTEKESQ